MGLLGDINIKPEQFKEILDTADPIVMKWLAELHDAAKLISNLNVKVSVNISGIYPEKSIPPNTPKENQ